MDLIIKLQQKKEVTSILAQWANFRDGIRPQIIASCHVHPLMASLVSCNPPDLILHGSYTSSPPVLSRSVVIEWQDPFLLQGENNVITEHLISENKNTLCGDKPYLQSPRNALLFCLFNAIFMGSKRISLVGFDPDRPEYFFSKNEDKKLEIVRSIVNADPWIAAWDGRYERVREKSKQEEHSLLELAAVIMDANPMSAVGSGWRLDLMEKGIVLASNICRQLNISLDYFGESLFLERCGLKRLC